MRGKYLIAVCDILGFESLVKNNSLDSVVNNALGWFRKALKHSLHGGTFPVAPPPTRELESHEHVGVAWFSDTILFYTKHDTDEAVGELLQAVASLLFETITDGVTKVRAGIAYGEMYVDPENSMYVGLPIVEAYKLEKAQQWAGAALMESACKRLEQCGPSGDVARWWVTPWDVPLKEGRAPMKTLVVNWNHGVHDLGWRLRWSESSELPPEEAALNCPDVYEKFMNTKNFHEMLCDDCKRAREAAVHVER
jgi:hypothetical protein